MCTYIYCLGIMYGLCSGVLNLCRAQRWFREVAFPLFLQILCLWVSSSGYGFEFFGSELFFQLGFNVLRSIVSETQKQWACAGVWAMGNSKHLPHM